MTAIDTIKTIAQATTAIDMAYDSSDVRELLERADGPAAIILRAVADAADVGDGTLAGIGVVAACDAVADAARASASPVSARDIADALDAMTADSISLDEDVVRYFDGCSLCHYTTGLEEAAEGVDLETWCEVVGVDIGLGYVRPAR
jgi:hypothetical protein